MHSDVMQTLAPADGLAAFEAAFPNTYFVDAVDGSDDNPGDTPGEAFATAAPVNGVPFVGTLTAGSDTITAATVDGVAALIVGKPLEGPGIAPGTTIVAVDEVADTITLSQPATASRVEQQFAAGGLVPNGGTVLFKADQRHPLLVITTAGNVTYGRYGSGAAPIIDHTLDVIGLSWVLDSVTVPKTYTAKYENPALVAPQRMDMTGGVGQHHGMARAASAANVAVDARGTAANWTPVYGALFSRTITFGSGKQPAYYSINDGPPRLFKEHQYQLAADGDAYARVAGTTLTIILRNSAGNPGLGGAGQLAAFTVSGGWFATRGFVRATASNAISIQSTGGVSRLTRGSGVWTGFEVGDSVLMALIDPALDGNTYFVGATSGVTLDLTVDTGVTVASNTAGLVSSKTIHLRVFGPNGAPVTNWTSLRAAGFAPAGLAAHGAFVLHSGCTLEDLQFHGADEGIDIGSTDITDTLVQRCTVRLCGTRGGRCDEGSHRTRLYKNRFDSIGQDGSSAQGSFAWKWGGSVETDITGCEVIENIVSYAGEDGFATQLKAGCTILFKDNVVYENGENPFDDKSAGEIERVGNVCISGLWSTGAGSDASTAQSLTRSDYTDELLISNRTNGMKAAPRTSGRARRVRAHSEQARALFASDVGDSTGGRDGKWTWEACEFTSSDNDAANPAGAIGLGGGDHDFLHCLGYLISTAGTYMGLDITPDAGVSTMLVRFFNSLLGTASAGGATTVVARRNAPAAATGIVLELRETGFDFPLNGANWVRQSTAPTDYSQAAVDAGVATALLVIDNVLADPTQPIPFTNPYKGMSWNGGGAAGVGTGTLTAAIRALGETATAAQAKAAALAAWTEAAGDWSIGGSLNEIPITAGTAFIKGEKVTSSSGGTAWVRNAFATYLIVSDAVGSFGAGNTLAGNRIGAATQSGAISSPFTLEMLAYDGEAAGGFAEGVAIAAAGGGTAKVVQLQDNGAAGWLMLANRSGTIADNDALLVGGVRKGDANGTPGSSQYRRSVPALRPPVLRGADRAPMEQLFVLGSAARTASVDPVLNKVTLSSGDLDADGIFDGMDILLVGVGSYAVGPYNVASHTPTSFTTSEDLTVTVTNDNSFELISAGPVSMGARVMPA